jgi:NADH-quinone oxidoreductase subunit J
VITASSPARRFGGFLAVLLGVELAWAISVAGGPPRAFGEGAITSVAALGRLLFTEYSFAFEATSLLILVAIVGAVVLARKERARKRIEGENGR